MAFTCLFLRVVFNIFLHLRPRVKKITGGGSFPWNECRMPLSAVEEGGGGELGTVEEEGVEEEGEEPKKRKPPPRKSRTSSRTATAETEDTEGNSS